jgi:hypothetical protein
MSQPNDDRKPAEDPVPEVASSEPSKSHMMRWSNDDIKLFMVTFAGTVVANLVTIIMVGLAIYAVRQGKDSKGHLNSNAYVQWGTLGFFIFVATLFMLLARWRISRLPFLGLVYAGLAIFFTLLLLVGYASGIK